jgi:hypothetical protein
LDQDENLIEDDAALACAGLTQGHEVRTFQRADHAVLNDANLCRKLLNARYLQS